jgi:hypothetical protein
MLNGAERRPKGALRRGHRCRLAAICGCGALIVASLSIAAAQDLEPRAYSASPVGTNFLIWAYAHSTGDLIFDPTIPAEDARGRINAATLGYFRSINLLGRSANITFLVPYGWGTASGVLAGEPAQIYRSGLADARFRLAVNIRGAPAMSADNFTRSRAKTAVGLSFITVAPTGQYDAAKLINLGNNRWGFKPELGVSRHIGRRWVLDAYAGVWWFTSNRSYRGTVREQAPMASTQLHISYNIRPRLWLALDANFYAGGQTTVGGSRNNDRQSNSRIGFTVACPLTRSQSFKLSYSAGAHVKIGGDFHTFAAAWQYMWGGGL